MGAGCKAGRPASHPAPCLWPGKAVQDGPKALGTCPHVGDPGDVPGSWLQMGTALAVAFTWAVNQQTKDFPLCLFSSLFLTFQ